MTQTFSHEYPSFEAWLGAHAVRSEYTARIIRSHARYPRATLAQLRRHPRWKEKPLSKVRLVPAYRRPPESLSLRELETRRRALYLLKEARRPERTVSLSHLARTSGTSVRTARRYLGPNVFRKRKGRWVPSRTDRIPRRLRIIENCQLVIVEVNDSEEAGKVGRYWATIGVALSETRQGADDSVAEALLSEFGGVKVRDSEGREHELETNWECIRSVVEQSERDFAIFEVYAEPIDVTVEIEG